MKFSIIIPAFNAEKTIMKCIDSALAQDEAEVIVVDDCSTDDTLKIAREYISVIYTSTPQNNGPGSARNYGILMARGDWIIFLDADDELAPGALKRLDKFIQKQSEDVDLIGFNWHNGDGVPRRRDGKWLNGSRNDLLSAYVALRMDGAVTFTVVKRSMLKPLGSHDGIRFRHGYHEDVDFLYNIYSGARETAYFDDVCYIKHGSGITGTVTEKHIDGFIEAWKVIVNEPWPMALKYPPVERGIIGVVATRVREIALKAESTSIERLLRHLFNTMPGSWFTVVAESNLTTQYAQIAKRFCLDYLDVDRTLFFKTWSCKDLNNSAYLGPNQVRACCKRFFVDGERKGDVVLIDNVHPQNGQITPAHIRDAKLKLLDAINAGEQTSCSGCPWLEFKEWPNVTEAVEYLSLEHHSVCNLRCTYCSPTYYEGKRPSYDVQNLVEELAPGLKTVVWGGGEPTLGLEFLPLSTLFAATGIHQRVLSNSVIYNKQVHDLLNDGKIELVTSIDAGTPELFKKIRGADKMFEVLATLAAYAQERPDLITIKYILTEENCGKDELEAFVDAISIYQLRACNFMISCDFSHDEATIDELRAALELHNLLRDIGVECVFIDDLCRIRIAPILKLLRQDALHQEPIMPPAVGMLLGLLVACPVNYQNVMIWGKGEQADRLLNDSLFFNTQHKLLFTLVDSQSYDVMMDRGDKIIIAASQSYPAIYRDLKQRGLSHRVIKELVI